MYRAFGEWQRTKEGREQVTWCNDGSVAKRKVGEHTYRQQSSPIGVREQRAVSRRKPGRRATLSKGVTGVRDEGSIEIEAGRARNTALIIGASVATTQHLGQRKECSEGVPLTRKETRTRPRAAVNVVKY